MQSNQGNVNGRRLGTRARYLNEVSIASQAQSVNVGVWMPGSRSRGVLVCGGVQSQMEDIFK